ncbi:MAG: Fic family protein [Wenzhouxiangellaceae bacterium]|nr:Fic family protein [Wenzhouxiangellaceae bacterium]
MATDRYQASGSQSEYQPGSNGRVLRNKLGITDPEEIDELELELLVQLYSLVMENQFPLRQLRLADLTEWHRMWLGNLYTWAGELRSVNVSKEDFQFAAASQIPRLLAEFEARDLHMHTPCDGMEHSRLVSAIAQCHVELILIHPFREGNGRLSRLLADVMAVQAGLDTLDYSTWDSDKPEYFAAIQSCLDRDYAAMEDLVSRALRASGA